MIYTNTTTYGVLSLVRDMHLRFLCIVSVQWDSWYSSPVNFMAKGAKLSYVASFHSKQNLLPWLLTVLLQWQLISTNSKYCYLRQHYITGVPSREYANSRIRRAEITNVKE